MNQKYTPYVWIFLIGALLSSYLVPLVIALLTIVGIVVVLAIYTATIKQNEDKDSG